jgi:hypothetical protein
LLEAPVLGVVRLDPLLDEIEHAARLGRIVAAGEDHEVQFDLGEAGLPDLRPV